MIKQISLSVLFYDYNISNIVFKTDTAIHFAILNNHRNGMCKFWLQVISMYE